MSRCVTLVLHITYTLTALIRNRGWKLCVDLLTNVNPRTSQVQSSQRKHQETFDETTVKTGDEHHHCIGLTATQEVRTGRTKQTLGSRNSSWHTEASHRTRSDFIRFYLVHRFLAFRFIRCCHSDLMFADRLLLYNRYHCYLKWLLIYKF
jgi:hypothetical protein